MRVAFAVIFALFLICFVVIIIEETFLGGRRRRKAEKNARAKAMEGETGNGSTTDPSTQFSELFDTKKTGSG